MCDSNLQCKFVGRHKELEQIKNLLLGHAHSLLLYGQPLVGKARLAREAAREVCTKFQARGMGQMNILVIDCVNYVTWPQLKREIFRVIFLNSESTDEENVTDDDLSCYVTLRFPVGRLLLLLLRLNKMKATGSDVDSLNQCLYTLSGSKVKTIVTSRRLLRMPCSILVKPLPLVEMTQLFRVFAPGADMMDFEPILSKLCFGLPSLVLRLAALANSHIQDSCNPPELIMVMTELMRKEMSEETEKLFSTLSPETQERVAWLVRLLDGTFSVRALQAAVGVDEANTMLVSQVNEEFPIVIQTDSECVSIQPFMLQHIRRMGHVNADDQARLRVVKLLGEMLLIAEQDKFVTGQDTAYGNFIFEWPNLPHLLRQAIDCTSDSYLAYLQVAVKADRLLVTCFPEEARQFYLDMATAAEKFGSKHDHGVLLGLLGKAISQSYGAGTEWEEALGYFRQALDVLDKETNSRDLLRLLCDMGKAYFRLNKLNQSDVYLKRALSLSNTVDVEDHRLALYNAITVRTHVSAPTLFKGQFGASEELLLETQEMCSEHAPCHPALSELLNTLGLHYERSGKSQDKALEYYLKCLEVKRHYQILAPGDLVNTLNNIGMQYRRRNDMDSALKYLEEAAAIRAKLGRWHYFTAITEQHLGFVCLQKGDYQRAERHLKEAAIIYESCTPKHDIRWKVQLCIAHVYVTNGYRDFNGVQKHLEEVCHLSDDCSNDMSDASYFVLFSAVEHLVQLHGWRTSEVQHYLDLVNRRWEEFTGDITGQMEEHRDLLDVLSAFTNKDATDDEKESLARRVLESCHICCLLKWRTPNIGQLWCQLQN